MSRTSQKYVFVICCVSTFLSTTYPCRTSTSLSHTLILTLPPFKVCTALLDWVWNAHALIVQFYSASETYSRSLISFSNTPILTSPANQRYVLLSWAGSTMLLLAFWHFIQRPKPFLLILSFLSSVGYRILYMYLIGPYAVFYESKMKISESLCTNGYLASFSPFFCPRPIVNAGHLFYLSGSRGCGSKHTQCLYLVDGRMIEHDGVYNELYIRAVQSIG